MPKIYDEILVPERLYGVLGNPVSHSLSPQLHNRLFARIGHPGAYFRWQKSAGELPDFFRAVRSLPIDGLSVTVPHKEAVIPLLDAVSERARAMGAVNTVYWEGSRLMGDNTDVAGFLAPLARRAHSLPERALVLGSGGAARAVLAGLRELALPEVSVCSRNAATAGELARDFNCLPLPWQEREDWLAAQDAALIVNCTPLGMRGKDEGASPLSGECFARLAARQQHGASPFLAYDIVYTPQRTRFLIEAARHGLECIGGLVFFAAQAAEQARLWTGARLDAAEALNILRPLLPEERPAL